jgi:hypothetical protein
MMDILAREEAMLEVKQSTSIVLFPNSISIRPYPDGGTVPAHPLATHRVTVDIQYASTTFSVLVTLDNPLDFVITTPLLLPMKYLDDKPFPPGYPNTTLAELLQWLVKHLKVNMMERIQSEEKLGGLSAAVENLVNMNIISEDSCEVAMVGDTVTLLVKFKPERDVKFASLKESVKEDKLLNGGGHFFVFKLVFKVDTGAFLPGEFCVSFSPDLADMLPELTNYSQPGLTAKLATDLVEFLMHVKDSVNKAITNAVDGWDARAKLLLQILSIFESGEIAVPYLDSDTMSVMDLAFRTQTKKVLLKIELSPNYPAERPQVTAFHLRIPTEGSRETRGSGEIKSQVVPIVGVENNEEEFVAGLMNFLAECVGSEVEG